MIDYTGQKFNKLRIVSLDHRDSKCRGYWLCQCECGNYKVCRVDHVTSGRTTSCGCVHDESPRKLFTTHGQTRTNGLYSTWINLRQRCNNPKNPSYADYGGRGIKVCAAWDDFTQFEKDVGLKPTPTHTLERKDNDGDYEPNNCCWATPKEQTNNRRPLSYRRLMKNWSQNL